MADKDNIDKALPNVDQDVPLPEEEIVVTEEDKLSEVTPDGAEVIMDEEGGAEVSFDPTAQQQSGEDHQGCRRRKTWCKTVAVTKIQS